MKLNAQLLPKLEQLGSFTKAGTRVTLFKHPRNPHMVVSCEGKSIHQRPRADFTKQLAGDWSPCN